MIMLLLTLLFIVVGDFIDAIPAIIIFMPIIVELTQTADINPVHMGVVIIVTLAFGLITPPLRTLPAHGVEIRRHKILQGYACVAADLHRFLRSHRVHNLLPGGRPVAAEAPVTAVRRLFSERERYRLYLPLGPRHAPRREHR
jgi:hypothetical protein